MQTMVAIDLETTGLDPDRDAIIEIGAVRFNGRRVEDEWATLVRPDRQILPAITQLTGISNEMVIHAPRFPEILGELVRFVADAPLLGHNVGFDLAFLRRRGVFLDNPSLDTYDLAAVLLPGADRYNLGALSQGLGIPLPATHRALDDARATHAVFINLYQRALSLPIPLLEQIVHLGETMDWGADGVFRQALSEQARQPIRGRPARQASYGPLFEHQTFLPETSLKPFAEVTGLDPLEVSALLEHGGAFSHHFPHFEFRPQQGAMLHAVTQSLSESHHLMVEAGTGTGKSIAYLIPAALWALENNTRVIISTNTINLQDQLMHKDIPDVRAALGLEKLQAAVLKGRANYLCPRRLESMLRTGPGSPEETRVLAKVLVWLQGTLTGDRTELNLTGPAERDIWLRISAQDEACTSETCVRRMGGICPFYRAHQTAHSAHLLVINHALLLADVATGNRVLPEYNYLIVDEAHHLEAATTNALSYRVSENDVERLLRELGSPKSGVLGRLLALTQDVLPPEQNAQFKDMVHSATDRAFYFQEQVRQFFRVTGEFLADQRDGREIGLYAHRERILPATRTQPAWAEVELAWDESLVNLRSLIRTLEQLGQAVSSLLEAGLEEVEDAFGDLGNLYRRLSELDQMLTGMVFEPSPELIYWAEVDPNGRRVSLEMAPLQIGSLMQEHLWRQKDAVILTSATLTATGEFDYLRNRLSAHDADELALGSPFDYETAALLYLVNDIPEPTDRHRYQRAVESGLFHLCKATGGRTLALFTSYTQLQQTAQVITPKLAEQGIQVYEQGTGASPHTLLEHFRRAGQAVLLGTRSFWEGVDVPGEALSVLVIVKLPFDVPSDPIFAARSETFDDPFYQYALPEAILRFRQGFGRLIRTQMDRGVVAILDRRILTKQYGALFIQSLPDCTIQTGSLAELPRAAAQWLNL